MTTYQPTGTGLCANCGQDVGQHDGGHPFTDSGMRVVKLCSPPIVLHACAEPGCHLYHNDPVHDVGRVLRCPESARRAASKSEYKRITALGGDILPPKEPADEA